jgi:hypothetical protein
VLLGLAPGVLGSLQARGAAIEGLSGFVENCGQWPEEVRFFARRGGVEATVRADALVFRAGSAVPLSLAFAAGARHVEGLEARETLHHFLVGDAQASGARGFERVALRGVGPGIDLVLRADGGAFEYDLELAPGAPLEDLVIEVEGASALELRAVNTLVAHTQAGEVEQRIHASWQGVEREPVACRFRLLEPSGERLRFGFEAPEWDGERALVLDPSLVYLTYVGGSNQELLIEAETDPSGAVLLLAKSPGGTPVTPGSFQSAPTFTEAWVGKLSADGSSLEWATYLGGSHTDNPKDLVLGPDGSVTVVGETWSPNFPVTPGAYKGVIGAGGITKADVFVSRLDATGTSLLWSTFYGGETSEATWTCGLYPNGDVLVAFDPFSADPPSTPGVIDELHNPGDLALFRLSADGSERLWQTYFRASTIQDIHIDADSNAYLGGYIFEQDAPLMTTPGVFKEVLAPGDGDGFVTKLNADGTELVWSTYFGGEPNVGSGNDRIFGIDLDAAGAVYIAGSTESDILPVTADAFQVASPGGGSTEGFAAKLLPNGTGLVWSTYVGAWGFAGGTSLTDVQVDSGGNAVVIGSANEPIFPVTPDAFQPVFIGPLPSSGDMLFCKLTAVGEGLDYATWLGGTGTDNGGELAYYAPSEDAVFAFGGGPSLPTTAGAYQPLYAGATDLAVARFDFALAPWRILGGGLAGKEVPNLVGLGPLTAGATTRLALRGAPATSPVFLVAGLQQIDFPLLGGILVPLPQVVVPVSSGALGDLDFAFAWPPSPSGTQVFFQAWTLDPLAPQGWAASNGLLGTSL